MNFILSTNGAKLMRLCNPVGIKDVHQLLRHVKGDSVCPRICMTEGCKHTTEVAPNVPGRYCVACGHNTTMPGRLLAKSGSRLETGSKCS